MQGLLLSELQQAQWISPKARAFSHVVTRIERLLITQSDVVFVSSSNLQAEIKKRYTVQSTIVKIPHGPLYFQKKSTVWLTLPTNKIICGYIGGLQTGKGMEEFLYYMKKLPSEYHFVIMGYPHDKIESTIRLYGLENMVTLTGRVLYENTLNYVEQCDYLFSPKRQVFGQANSKLFTYKQTGKRVLCYDYPEYRTILGTQGIYVDPKKNNWVDVIRSLK